MKTIKQLISQKPVFLDLFEDGLSDIASQFDEPISKLENYKFLYAYYDIESYSGDAYVLFVDKGKIYEVSGGHCSCYGLEGQFEAEEVPLEVLYHRLENKLYNYEHLRNIL